MKNLANETKKPELKTQSPFEQSSKTFQDF